MRKIKISAPLKSIAKISGGTIVGQIVSIVTLPVITRLYGAEVMGIWAMITALSYIVQGVCDLGITSGLMLEEEAKQVDLLYQVISTFSLIICIASCLVLFPYFKIIKQLSLFDSCFFSLLVGMYAFTVKQVNTCYTWLNRYKKYNILMMNPVVNYVTVAIFAIGFGLMGFLSYGYYFAVLFGQIFTVVNMKREMPKRMFSPETNEYKLFLRKYKELVKYQLPNNCVIQIRDQLPNILIGSLFGNTVLGYYSVSTKILRMPVTFIGQAVGKVFYQTISEMDREGKKIGEYVSRNFNRAINIAILPVLGLCAVGDIVAVLFFGNDYVMAGQILRIVVFQTFFTFVITCTQGLEIVLRKQKYSLISTICQTLFLSAGLYLGYIALKSVYASVLFMVVIYCVIQIIYYNKLFDVMEQRFLPHVIKMAICLIVIMILTVMIRFVCLTAIQGFGIEKLNWFKIGIR